MGLEPKIQNYDNYIRRIIGISSTDLKDMKKKIVNFVVLEEIYTCWRIKEMMYD